jgi:ComF family protein
MLWPAVRRGLPQVDFNHILALADYQWPLSRLLTGLKFSAKIANADALAKLFVEHCVKALPNPPQQIIPLPLHKTRYLARKFNQSIELAKRITKFSQIPMDSAILYRQRATRPQTDLSARQRRKNLQQAFALDESAQQRLQKLEHVALFDDVITTGSTMNSAYNLLRAHNPRLKIDIWSICLTLCR